MRILIIEDDIRLLDEIIENLAAQRYDVEGVKNGESALDKIFDNEYDLIVLDIMIPEVDGLTVLREIRKSKIKTPVLILSAKSTISDKIQGLDCGADDYLGKPFAMAELLARIRSLLRRSSEDRHAVLECDDLLLDTNSRVVQRAGVRLILSPKEFSILEFLMYNKNKVVPRFVLAEHVWGEEYDPFETTNLIDAQIKNIRKKIGDGKDKRMLQTVWGVGFIISDKAQ